MQMTPTERLILLSLAQKPNQTAAELQMATGVKSTKPFRRTLRTLVLAGRITLDEIAHTYAALTRISGWMGRHQNNPVFVALVDRLKMATEGYEGDDVLRYAVEYLALIDFGGFLAQMQAEDLRRYGCPSPLVATGAGVSDVVC